MIRALPDITVLIPTYNRAAFLPAAIESALDQDYSNLRVLALDDGSSDGTPAILEGYAARQPERFGWVRHENMGQARSYNRGFELVDSELVCLLASDDELVPGAVSWLVQELLEDPEAVVAYGDYTLIDEHGAPLTRVTALDFDAVEAVRLHVCSVGPGAVVRREVVDRVGGWDPHFVYCPDFDFWIRLGLVGRFVHVREPLVRWRQHSGSLTHSVRSLRGARAHVQLVEKLYARDDLPDELLAVKDEAYRNALFVAGTLCRPEVNAPGERFVVADTLTARVTPDRDEPVAQLAVKEAELRRAVSALGRMDRELADVHQRAAELNREVTALHAHVAQLERRR